MLRMAMIDTAFDILKAPGGDSVKPELLLELLEECVGDDIPTHSSGIQTAF
jgi:hypothetical protein